MLSQAISLAGPDTGEKITASILSAIYQLFFKSNFKISVDFKQLTLV